MLLYVNWDGFSYHWYTMALKRGVRLDALCEMARGGALLKNQHCGVPAITNPMQQTLVSGAWPNKTGNCYAYYDKITRRVKQTLRLNRCENLVEAALRQGRTCASVHGWYFENRGCTAGDEVSPYIQSNLSNFQARTALALDYLSGAPVPSGDTQVRMVKRPDFLALYADDLDNVCHNGSRLPYAGMERAKTLAAWRDNFVYTLERMDVALGKLMNIDGVTLALAADHGGMPFNTAAFKVGLRRAQTPVGDALLAAIMGAGVRPYVLKGREDCAPEGAEAVLLMMGTQAQLTFVRDVPEAVKARLTDALNALPFVRAALDKQALGDRGAHPDFADVYVATRAPFSFTPSMDAYVGGSHAALEKSVLHVFCAFYGAGVKKGVLVKDRTDLTDFAPTVSKLMGMDAPRDSVGRVITRILA